MNQIYPKRPFRFLMSYFDYNCLTLKSMSSSHDYALSDRSEYQVSI